MSSRQPTGNYMKFVHSMATKILDPKMKVTPVPKTPKTVRIGLYGAGLYGAGPAASKS